MPWTPAGGTGINKTFYVDLDIQTNPSWQINNPSQPLGLYEFFILDYDPTLVYPTPGWPSWFDGAQSKGYNFDAYDTFYIRGQVDATLMPLNAGIGKLWISRSYFKKWGSDPWRMKLKMFRNSPYNGTSLLSGGIIETEVFNFSDTQFYPNPSAGVHQIKNSSINATIRIDTCWLASPQIYGSTIKSPIMNIQTLGIAGPDTFTANYYLKDSLIDIGTVNYLNTSGYPQTGYFNNFAFVHCASSINLPATISAPTGYVLTNIGDQWDWVPPVTWPTWDADQAEWDEVLLLSGITDPPLSGTPPYTIANDHGVGLPDLTPFDTNLFDQVRESIGTTYTPSVTADFHYTQNYLVNYEVSFLDDSVGGPISWAWTFGDGTTSTAQNPTHTYASPGHYSVALTATGSNSDTITKTVDVIAVPVADFSAHQQNLNAQLVDFTDLSTNEPTSWLWNFGGGHTSDQQTASFEFDAVGAHSVSLTATNAAGSHTVTKSITTYEPVLASFNAVQQAYPSKQVNFTDTTIHGAPDTWAWTFGDGATATTQNSNHTYAAGGTYTASLTASNSVSGSSHTVSQQVTVIVAPVTDFNYTQPILTVKSLNFTDISTNYPTSWDWDFGDGSIHSTEEDPVHIYTAMGTYTVILVATNAAGSNTRTRVDVAVQGAVISSFTVNQPNLNLLGFDFTDTSLGIPSATTWLWSFGDGATSTSKNTSHTYAAKGSYNVTLTASNTIGGVISPVQSISANTLPSSAFTFSQPDADLPTVNFTHVA